MLPLMVSSGTAGKVLSQFIRQMKFCEPLASKCDSNLILQDALPPSAGRLRHVCEPIRFLLSDVFFCFFLKTQNYFSLFQANEIINIKVRAGKNTTFPFFFFFFFRINEELFLAAMMACGSQTF